jgi:uncharacterized protein YjbI with pentapeptide repeats
MILAGRLRWDSSPWLTGTVVLVLVGAAAIGGWYAGHRTNDVVVTTATPIGPPPSSIQLAGVDLRDRQLPEVALVRANLTGASFRRSGLAHADLRAVNLTGGDLAETNLTSANLASARLLGADLSAATLTGACLMGADLRGADLSKTRLAAADLRGADLRGVVVSDTDFTDALQDASTRWPEGVSRVPHAADASTSAC